jgi:hypothetical protein
MGGHIPPMPNITETQRTFEKRTVESETNQ